MPKAKDAPSDEPVGSIRDALGSAWDEQESGEVEQAATDTETSEAKAERARAKDGKFAKAEKAETPEPEKPAATDQAATPSDETQVVEAIGPEEHWSDADKAAFLAENPTELRKWFKERYKRIEADHTRKSQEAASLRSFKQSMDATLEPYRQEFALAGLDDVGGVRYLLAVRDSLKSKPAETLQWLAQQYGVDLRQIAEGAPQPDPATQAVMQQVQQFGSKLTQIEQNIQNERIQQATRQIDAFASEKDEAGKPKHPHFEAVSGTMTQLMSSGMVQIGDLETAYQKAVVLQGLNTPAPAPTIKTPQAQEQDQKKEDLEKAAAAAKAKKAAAGVSGSGSAKAERKMTLREELAERMNGSLQ